MSKNITKEEWLEERIFVDEYGREYNLSDVPMALMTRKKAYRLRNFSQKAIDALWHEFSQYNRDDTNLLEDI